jgi:hypothetical protein
MKRTESEIYAEAEEFLRTEYAEKMDDLQRELFVYEEQLLKKGSYRGEEERLVQILRKDRGLLKKKEGELSEYKLRCQQLIQENQSLQNECAEKSLRCEQVERELERTNRRSDDEKGRIVAERRELERRHAEAMAQQAEKIQRLEAQLQNRNPNGSVGSSTGAGRLQRMGSSTSAHATPPEWYEQQVHELKEQARHQDMLVAKMKDALAKMVQQVQRKNSDIAKLKEAVRYLNNENQKLVELIESFEDSQAQEWLQQQERRDEWEHEEEPLSVQRPPPESAPPRSSPSAPSQSNTSTTSKQDPSTPAQDRRSHGSPSQESGLMAVEEINTPPQKMPNQATPASAHASPAHPSDSVNQSTAGGQPPATTTPAQQANTSRNASTSADSYSSVNSSHASAESDVDPLADLNASAEDEEVRRLLSQHTHTSASSPPSHSPAMSDKAGTPAASTAASAPTTPPTGNTQGNGTDRMFSVESSRPGTSSSVRSTNRSGAAALSGDITVQVVDGKVMVRMQNGTLMTMADYMKATSPNVPR